MNYLGNKLPTSLILERNVRIFHINDLERNKIWGIFLFLFPFLYTFSSIACPSTRTSSITRTLYSLPRLSETANMENNILELNSIRDFNENASNSRELTKIKQLLLQ